MDQIAELVESLLDLKYAGSYRVVTPDRLWAVDGYGATVVVTNPDGTHLSVGSVVGSSSDYWKLCGCIARANKGFSTGRAFVGDGAEGQYYLITEDYLPPWLFEADNALDLAWLSIGTLQQHTKEIRDAAMELEQFVDEDASAAGFANLVARFL